MADDARRSYPKVREAEALLREALPCSIRLA